MAGGWRGIPLGQVAQINPDAIDNKWPYAHINYIDISSVGEGQIDTPPQHIEISAAPGRAKRLLKKGDTVLSTVRPNRRSMFFAANPEKDWVVSTGFAVLRPKSHSVDPRFLYACVFNQAFTDYLVTREKGAAYPAVSSDDIASAPILLPPLDEQRAIAKILGDLDDKIDLNRRMNKTLEAMAQALFKSWFVDFEPVRAKMEGRWKRGQSLPGLPAELYDLFPDTFVDSELGKIPRGWGRRKLGEFFPVFTGKKDANYASEKGQYPFFTCAQEQTLFSKTYSFDGNAILLAGNGDFNVKWYRGKFEAYQRTYVLIPHQPVLLPVLHQLLCCFLKDIVAGHKGSVINYLTKSMITDYQVAFPTNDIVSALARTLAPLYSALECNGSQNSVIAKMRDDILSKLLSGEIKAA